MTTSILLAAALTSSVNFCDPVVVPVPELMSADTNAEVRIDASLKVKIECPCPCARGWAAAQLASWFGWMGRIELVTESDPTASWFRWTGTLASGTEPILEGDEAYRLVAAPGEITITARTLQGVRYALYTLRQTAERDSRGRIVKGYRLPAMTIEDAPILKFRAYHICWFPELTTDFIERQIRLAAYYKFNYVILESWGVFKSERNPWFSPKDAPLTHEVAKRLADLGRDLGVTVIPQLNVYGHAAAARSCTGKHATLDRHPECASLFEPQGGWNWCLSNPEARAVVRELVAEEHEAFGNPPFFHIGCDEADRPSCASCRAAVPYEALVADHITEVVEMLRQRGARTLMWHDMLLQNGDKRWSGFYANGTKESIKLLERLPKDVVICDWYYGGDPSNSQNGSNMKTGNYPTLEYFHKLGFDTVTCPWEDWRGIAAQTEYARNHGLFGVIQTVWHHYRGDTFADLVQNAATGAWRGKRIVTPSHWAKPFATHWRQCGWDMGRSSDRESGYNDEQVTRGILAR